MLRRTLVVLAASGLVAATALAQTPKPAASAGPALETLTQKASYGLGLSLGRNFKAQGLELDSEILIRGLRDGLTEANPLLTDEQIEESLRAFQENLMAKQVEQAKALAAENKAAGDAFMADNAKKPGVKATPSGLQYKVVTEGAGATPKESDMVTVHYRGTLTDGTVFDSSYERNEPASFPVNGVIQGWVEALQLMKVGSKWQIVLPPDIAYGENPPPGSPIPPNSVLLFDVELISIDKPAPAPPDTDPAARKTAQPKTKGQ